ncbi:MAG: hypothetical protein ACE15F_16400 [bacterium]
MTRILGRGRWIRYSPRPWAAVLGFLLLFPAAGRVQEITAPLPPIPEMRPIEFGLNLSTLILEETGTEGEYLSPETASFRLLSWIDDWRVSCVAEAAVGPEGETIPPTHFYLLGGANGASASLEQPVVIAEGGPLEGKPVDAASFRLCARIDPLQPAGEYRGTLLFYIETGRKGTVITGPSLPFMFQCREFIKVWVSEDMAFGTCQPGINQPRDHISQTTPKVTVLTNRRGVKVHAEMTDLSYEEGPGGGGGPITGSQLALAYGETPGLARGNAASAPLGGTAIDWYPYPRSGAWPFCDRSIYLGGKVSIDLHNSAGFYRGVIYVTCEAE